MKITWFAAILTSGFINLTMITTVNGNAYKRWFACFEAKIVKDLSLVVFSRYQGKTLKSFFCSLPSRSSESGQPSKS